MSRHRSAMGPLHTPKLYFVDEYWRALRQNETYQKESELHMNSDILKNGGSNNREINTDSLKIYGNCLEFKDTIVQLSNVSLVANNPLAIPKFPLWTIAALIVGLVFLCMEGAIRVLGLLLLCGSGFVIYLWYKLAEQEKRRKKLVIATNSGQSFSILFEKGDFLDSVVNALTEIIAHPDHHSDIIINIKDNKIGPGGHIIDTVNEINSIGGHR